MKGKLLITGGRGMFATDLAREASEVGLEIIALGHQDLDITRPEQVRQVLDAIRPRYVVNTVGIGVDFCESNPEEGYRVHAWGVACLARGCQRIDATLVTLSTCGLFGDEVKFYSEYDPVVLKTSYARSKYLGELEAQLHCSRTVVVRCGWLFGGATSHARNFVYHRYLEAKAARAIKSAGDKYGSPTYTRDLGLRLLQLLESEEYGTYHLTNQGGGSRYDYVRCIVEAFGLDTVVETVDSTAFPRAANTPDSEMLDNLNLRFLGFSEPEPWQEAVQRYVLELKAQGIG